MQMIYNRYYILGINKYTCNFISPYRDTINYSYTVQMLYYCNFIFEAGPADLVQSSISDAPRAAACFRILFALRITLK